MDSRFIARMEQLLHLYSLPYDLRYPTLCFDERPCFLIGEAVAGLEMRAGHVRREHYAYEKHGSCALLMAIEPQTGKRLAQVRDHRTKQDYAQFMHALAARYPTAQKIRVVQDNLNTHDVSAFYEAFPAEDAFALAQRFEFHYTPKKASWLNMIEIEFSALSRQCLARRIASRAQLEQEVLIRVTEREVQGVTIDWQFSIDTARQKLQRHYQQLREEPPQTQET